MAPPVLLLLLLNSTRDVRQKKINCELWNLFSGEQCLAPCIWPLLLHHTDAFDGLLGVQKYSGCFSTATTSNTPTVAVPPSPIALLQANTVERGSAEHTHCPINITTYLCLPQNPKGDTLFSWLKSLCLLCLCLMYPNWWEMKWG